MYQKLCYVFFLSYVFLTGRTLNFRDFPFHGTNFTPALNGVRAILVTDGIRAGINGRRKKGATGIRADKVCIFSAEMVLRRLKVGI